ncbi:MAG: recombinase RecT, partial [Alphaproteobacteria bacterium]
MTNENKQIVETTQDICDDRISSLSLITNSDSMKNVTALAAMMAESKVTVPKHLQGSKGDCLAIIIQASNWGMNPFTVAQKTHLVNGVLGYEPGAPSPLQTNPMVPGIPIRRP